MFPVFRGYISQRSGTVVRRCEFGDFAGDFLSDGPWIAEPDHFSQRREAVRVCREVAGWLESLARRG